MARNKYSRFIYIFCILALHGASVSSCSVQEETDLSPSFSDKEITFTLSEWMPVVQSRAITFNKDNLLDPSNGGGNFTIYAYMADDPSKVLINGKRGWYHEGEWYIMDDKDQIRKYYWPNSGKLNFFAYMPNSNYDGKDGYVSKETHVTYDKDTRTFSCNLPAIAGDDTPMQEFIFAYATQQKEIDTNTKKAKPVELKFEHPFALINFKLGSGSYRMTINKFTFSKIDENGNESGIYLNGTFSTSTETGWKLAGKPEPYTAIIDKRVPGKDDEYSYKNKNYNTELSDGGFIVLPQSITGVRLTMSFQRDENPEETCYFDFTGNVEWKAGHKYTYTINCGDNNEEIYFNVNVSKWDNNGGYEQGIEVE